MLLTAEELPYLLAHHNSFPLVALYHTAYTDEGSHSSPRLYVTQKMKENNQKHTLSFQQLLAETWQGSRGRERWLVLGSV